MYKIYEVEEGETINSIANKLGITSDVLAALNGLTVNNNLTPGSYIIIPFADEDALFHIDCIYRRADTERLRFLVDMLLESRDIVSKHRAS